MSKSWIVRMRREIIEDYVLEGCTEEQARNDPFRYVVRGKHHDAVIEVDQINYEVLSVKANA